MEIKIVYLAAMLNKVLLRKIVMSRTKEISKKIHKYRIISYTPLDNFPNWIFIIQNTRTLKKRKITLHKLVVNLPLLSQFSIEDILIIAYAAAEGQILLEKQFK